MAEQAFADLRESGELAKYYEANTKMSGLKADPYALLKGGTSKDMNNVYENYIRKKQVQKQQKKLASLLNKNVLPGEKFPYKGGIDKLVDSFKGVKKFKVKL